MPPPLDWSGEWGGAILWSTGEEPDCIFVFSDFSTYFYVFSLKWYFHTIIFGYLLFYFKLLLFEIFCTLLLSPKFIQCLLKYLKILEQTLIIPGWRVEGLRVGVNLMCLHFSNYISFKKIALFSPVLQHLVIVAFGNIQLLCVKVS